MRNEYEAHRALLERAERAPLVSRALTRPRRASSPLGPSAAALRDASMRPPSRSDGPPRASRLASPLFAAALGAALGLALFFTLST